MNNSKLCLFSLIVIFSALGAYSTDWKAAAALEVKPGIESVKVKTLNAKGEILLLEYSVPDAVVKKETGSSVTLQMGNATNFGYEGEPVLPIIPVKVVIPSGRKIDNVKVSIKNKTTLTGKYEIAYQKAYIPLIQGAKVRTIQPKASIYQSDNAFPGQIWQIVSMQKKHGVTIAIVNINPVIYHPLSQEVVCINDLELEITTIPDKDKLSKAMSFPERLDPKSAGIENPEALETYPASAPVQLNGVMPLGLCDPASSYNYVIVTSAQISTATTDFTVRDLIAHRQSQGISATIVTIEQILSGYTGIDDAEKLRNFIKDAYTNWETQYVLLGGDINIIPMRKLYSVLEGGEQIPSDLYYQCLDGTYNSDNDSSWGETTDGPGGSDVDLMAEVFVGRASAENPAEMSNFVYKTLKYENEPASSSYLSNALMCGEYLGFGGVSDYATGSMEEIRTGSSANGYTTTGFAACPSMTVNTLYDSAGYSWTTSEIVNIMNSNQYSIINHLGHANYNYVMKFYNETADVLTNTNPLFLYSQGCIPGNFEVDCMAEHLTTSNRHGLYGGVLNSRYGWGAGNSTNGPSQPFDRQFWDAYFGENINQIGKINADSHEDNLNTITDSYTRWCYYETNLFGDPATTMRGKITGPLVSFYSYTASDNLGNNDSIINPGEQIRLSITLANAGTEGASNVSAVMSSTDPNVTITQGTSGYGTVPCCASQRQSTNDYVIQINPACPTPRIINLGLQITDGTNIWNSQFTIPVNTSNIISGDVKTFTGSLPLANATVTFSGQSSYTVATDANGRFSKRLIGGTYSVSVHAAEYLDASPVTVTVPPNNTTLAFLMKKPVLSLSQSSVNETVSPGETKNLALTISNHGDTTLRYTIAVEENTVIKSGFTYDSSHFISLDKGAPDKRTGNPVTLSSGGPDQFGYRWKDSNTPGGPAFLWNDISTTGRVLPTISSCDDCYESAPLSFTFNFYGNPYNSIYVSSNGYITLGSGYSAYSNYPLPSTSAPANLIAAFFDDLNTGNSGDIYFQDFGDKAIIQFNNVAPYSGTGSITFQIVLSANGAINYYYQTVTMSAISSTVGIQNQGQTTGLTIAYNTAYVQNGLAVEISKAPQWLTVSPVTDTCLPGANNTLTLHFDASELAAGTYTGFLSFSHNDPAATNPYTLPVTLVVQNLQVPVISRHPSNINTFTGETATFSITASGANILYQWKKNGINILNANDSSYTTPILSISDNGAQFNCIVSNTAGSDTSNIAILHVLETPPVILLHPENVSVTLGSASSFSVVASGSNLAYQWQRDDSLILGATSREYRIAITTINDSGAVFRCVVSNTGGSVTSNPAILSVREPQPRQLQIVSVGASVSAVSHSTHLNAESVTIGNSVSGSVQGNRFKLFLK